MDVTAVIPALNEEKTVGCIVALLRRMPEVSEVVVVDDGSTDRTSQVASESGARVITLPENIGKGGAVRRGVEAANTEVVLFLDADLRGLTEQHIRDLLNPVLLGGADMSLGLFDQGRVATDLAQAVTPYLTGQRAVRRWLLEDMNGMDLTGFGFEVALTRRAKERGARVIEVTLKDLTHVMKEEKLGLVKGFMARMRMYWEIMKTVQKG
ncbi:MAG: glycosyltransferase family 2 protein [Bacillota bacterium]